MASKQKAGGGGSILLKLLILVLAAILVYAVQFPKKQWELQEQHRKLARERMENLYNASLQYYYFNKRFPLTIDEMLAALDTTKVEAGPQTFMIEPKIDMDLAAQRQDLLEAEPSAERDAELARVETLLRDSLLVTVEDTMRIARFRVDDRGRVGQLRGDGDRLDLYTTLVWAEMKPLYEGVGTDTLYLLSEEPITVVRRKAGDLSRDLWASTGGRFLQRADSAWFGRGATVMQPARNYSYTLPLAEIGADPATGKTFVMKHVAKYSYKGSWLFTVDGTEGEALADRVRQQTFLNEVKGLGSDAIGAAFQALADSAAAAGDPAYRMPDETKNAIVIRESLAAATQVKKDQRLLAERDNSRVAGADSLDWFTSAAVRADVLFPEYKGATAEQFDALLQDAAVQALLARTRMAASYDSVKIDTVGVALYSPITGDEQYYGGWKHLFEVDPPGNDGSIYNGTKSWE